MFQKLVILNLCLAPWLHGCMGDPSGNAPSALMDRPELPGMAVTVKGPAERPGGARCWVSETAPTADQLNDSATRFVVLAGGAKVKVRIKPPTIWAKIEPFEAPGHDLRTNCWVALDDLNLPELVVKEKTALVELAGSSDSHARSCELPQDARIRFGMLAMKPDNNGRPSSEPLLIRGKNLVDDIIDVQGQGARCNLTGGLIDPRKVTFKNIPNN